MAKFNPLQQRNIITDGMAAAYMRNKEGINSTQLSLAEIPLGLIELAKNAMFLKDEIQKQKYERTTTNIRGNEL